MGNSLRNALQSAHIGARLTEKVLHPTDPIQILVEVVSAQDLLRADLQQADPYVVVRMGDMEVHKTQHVKKT